MAEASVAVIVVTFNSAPLLPELITSLSTGLRPLRWQLVVADNASTDQTVATVAGWAPEATLVRMGRNAGYAAGINAGVQAAGAHDAYLVLNPDVRLTAGCVPTLMAALDPDTGVAVPRLVDARGDLILSMRREPSVLRTLGDALLGAERAGWWALLGEVAARPQLYERRCRPDWAEGSTQLISRACWVACDGWDERYFLYSEEADFDLRARDAGFGTVYEPAAQAVHLEGGSAGSPHLWALLTLNRVRMYSRRHRRPATAAFWAVLVLREASRSLMGKKTSRAALRALLNPRRLTEAPGPWSIRQPAY